MRNATSRMFRPTVALLLGVAWLGCDQEASEPAGATESPAEGAEQPAVGKVEASGLDDTQQAVEGGGDAEPIVVEEAGLKTPESVLYVPEQDVYLVSNIQGKPTGKDDDGFISKLGPDGSVIELKWIDGADENVTLNAPKGSAVVDGVLYVADIDTVRRFDARTGEPRGEIPIEGAGFVNDISAADDGTLYVSDTGSLSAGRDGPDAVYVIVGGKVEPLAKDPSLGGPNGVLAAADGVWVVTTRSGELFRLTSDGEKKDVQKLPAGGADGIVRAGDGSLLVSSWEAGAVLRGRPGGELVAVVEGVKSPADIGYDSKRDRVLIPVFQGDAVRIQPLATPSAP